MNSLSGIKNSLNKYLTRMEPKKSRRTGRLYRKILIVKPSSLGDVVHSLPFLNSLRACFPKADIHWIIAQGLENLLDGHPMINRLITINKDMWKKISKTGDSLKEIRHLFSTLRNEKYDLVVDLQGLLRSGIITMATRAPVRIGFAEAREGGRLCYTDLVRGGKGVHAVDRYLKIAEALGCDTDQIIFPFPLAVLRNEDVRGFKNTHKDYAVIVPGARWDTKRWPARNFGEIASRLPFNSIVVGGGEEELSAREIIEISRGKAVSLAGRTSLKDLIDIMRDARFVISNDSGPMHIAAGLKVPVVSLFGPTSPALTGPYGDGHIIIRSQISCAPCFKRKCRSTLCMHELTVDHVYEKISRLL